MTASTRTHNTDHAPEATTPLHTVFDDHGPATHDEDVAYYTDPDAAQHVLDATATARDLLGELTDDLDGLRLSDPTHRTALREHFHDILATLDRIEDYDDETIRLTIGHQD